MSEKKRNRRNKASIRVNLAEQSNSFKSAYIISQEPAEGEWKVQRSKYNKNRSRSGRGAGAFSNLYAHNTFSPLDERKKRMEENSTVLSSSRGVPFGDDFGANSFSFFSGKRNLNEIETINTPNGTRKRLVKFSSGVACVRKNPKNNKLEILLIKKRYTYAYSEFMLGGYFVGGIKHGSYGEAKLIELFSEMSMDDKLTILSMDFSAMWYRLWLNNKKTRQYYHLKTRFESMFKVDEGKRLREIIKASSNGNDLWEIPKGRKNYENESDVKCAIREFEEETGIIKSNYKLFPNIRRKCTYVDKNVKYVITYFLAFTNRFAGDNHSINILNKEQINEVGEIRWMDIDMIRSIDTKKRLENMIRPMFKIMKKQIKF